jgi:hypothetical protein
VKPCGTDRYTGGPGRDKAVFLHVQFFGGSLSLGPPQHAARAHRRTFSKTHEKGFQNFKGEFSKLWDGIIEVLRKGGQFGDTFFEGRGEEMQEYLKRVSRKGRT